MTGSDFIDREFVHIGFRCKGGTYRVVFRVVQDDKTLSDEFTLPVSSFKAKIARRVIGGIYIAKFNKDMTRIVGVAEAEYQGKRWPLEDLVALQALDTEAKVKALAVRLETDAKKSTDLEKMVAPLQAQYHNLINKGLYQDAEALVLAVGVLMRKKLSK